MVAATMTTRPMRWIALGSLAMMAMSSFFPTVAAEDCPPPATVTVTETSTVWAGLLCVTPIIDSNWPTKTVQHTVAPENCPPSPRYACYVVQTTTLSAKIPQATIHMVLPSEESLNEGEQKDTELGAESLEDVIEEMEALGFKAQVFSTDGEELKGQVDKEAPSVPEFVADKATPLSLSPPPPLPTITEAAKRPDEDIFVPACMNFKTETVMGACPPSTPLALNSDGCAIITSTAFAMTTARAVPGVARFQKADNDRTYVYTVTVHDGGSPSLEGGDSGDDEDAGVGHRKKKHHKTHHHRHHEESTEALEPLPMTPPPSAVSLPGPEDVVMAAPLSVVPTKTTLETTFSTHVNYTLSFDFTYGIPTASPKFPELPPPSKMTPPPVPEHEIVVTTSPSEEVPVTPTETTTSSDSSIPTAAPDTPSQEEHEDEEFVPVPAPSDLTGIGSEDDESDPEHIEDNTGAVDPADPSLEVVADPPLETSDPPLEDVADPPLETSDPPLEDVADPPIAGIADPSPFVGDPISTSIDSNNEEKTKKACQACAEPCLVEIDVVAKAEVPMLQKLFKNKIQNALASLKLTLQNDIASTSGKDGLFAKMNVDSQTSDLFQKTVDERCAEIEAEYLAKLPSRCEKVVQETGCATGECLQSEADKAVQRLDVMLSTNLARDVSNLRTELIVDFKKKCDEHNSILLVTANVDVEKRSLLGSILGENLGGALDKTLNSVTGTVDQVVKPLTGGKGLIQPLVEGLTDSVKTVVDSFVSNCNRKGLLDFDTEKGVGTLSAITDLSLDLFKIVCVKANVDAKVPTK